MSKCNTLKQFASQFFFIMLIILSFKCNFTHSKHRVLIHLNYLRESRLTVYSKSVVNNDVHNYVK